jgi:hypothetical protein
MATRKPEKLIYELAQMEPATGDWPNEAASAIIALGAGVL